MRVRLDRLMVDRGLVESREKAQALIMAGEVLVDGQKASKPGQATEPECAIEVLARPPYVSRGGLKLAAALRRFEIHVARMVCVDIGASTGGFTDALLQAGAERVHAVDVGAGQLAWSLRTDPRVIVKEGINARELKPEDIGEPVDLVTCDVSFISVTLILPAMVALLRGQGSGARGRGPGAGDWAPGVGVQGLEAEDQGAATKGQRKEVEVREPQAPGPRPPTPGPRPPASGPWPPTPSPQMVILIKPQFEVGKGQVGKGGIVREPELHRAACEKVTLAVRQLGFETHIMESPILGAEGNKEFLLYAHH